MLFYTVSDHNFFLQELSDWAENFKRVSFCPLQFFLGSEMFYSLCLHHPFFYQHFPEISSRRKRVTKSLSGAELRFLTVLGDFWSNCWPKTDGVMSVRSPVMNRSNAGMSPLSKSSLLRVSSFLSNPLSKSNRLEADMSGEFLTFPTKSLRSGFWTSLFGPRPVEPVIDFTVMSTLGITTLSMAVKIASSMQHSQP